MDRGIYILENGNGKRTFLTEQQIDKAVELEIFIEN